MIYLDYFHFVMIFSEKKKSTCTSLKKIKKGKKIYNEKDPRPRNNYFYQFLFILPEVVFVCAYLYPRYYVCVYIYKAFLGSGNWGG